MAALFFEIIFIVYHDKSYLDLKALFIIYFSIKHHENYLYSTAFFLGLIQDLIFGTILGGSSLRYLILSFCSRKLYYSIKNFDNYAFMIISCLAFVLNTIVFLLIQLTFYSDFIISYYSFYLLLNLLFIISCYFICLLSCKIRGIKII